MKNLVLFFTIIAIVFWSCDGRQTKKEALQRAVSEFNLRNFSSEISSYHPETYVEIVTDTIISNNITVRIKNYSLLDEHVLISNITKTINYQRVFESEITVSTASKAILSTRISAKKFEMIDTDPFWNNATLQHTWVNQELSSVNDITLDISFINPQNHAYRLYRMSIDSHGQQSLKLIEQHS